MSSKRIFYLLFPLLFACSVARAHRPPFLFSPNKGQWHPNVLYRTTVPGGEMYLERDGITFRYYDQQKLKYIHDHRGQALVTGDENLINGVTVRTKLLGANVRPEVTEKLFTEFYENWFIGQDVSKHVSKVFPAEELTYRNVYPGIDWVWYEKGGFLKYDFKVKAGSDPNLVKTRYTGQNRLYTDELGNLLTATSLAVLKEEKPLAYQIGKTGDTVIVACQYRVDGDVVSYVFPNGYDVTADLVIDPSLIFSTYSGSFANNFGYTATYDSKGFLYSGGNVFDIGYHTTPGAFQVTYGGGNIDCAISKYDTTGSFMVWSTYLGGSGSEMPHSMVVNSLGQLLVYGTTGSHNFPVTGNAFDKTFNGGTSLTQVGVGYIDPSGSDIFISRFSENGTQLLASTYLGGSANDGLNLGDTLNHNYADLSRGEIDVDFMDNIYLATTTASANFPVTAGALQPAMGGGAFDGVVVKMNNSLSTLIWSTYLGGSADDAVYSLAVDKQNNVVITGGTGSSDFPVQGPNFQTHNGNIDAFVSAISSNGTALLKSVLYGTALYDQAYFVELDKEQNVYILGQTDAVNGYFFTGTGFGVANGGQFISKFTSDFSIREWSTAFGNENGHPDISPTAFLVDVCNKIYLSGWGGSVNGTVPGSTVVGLPITPDAYQLTPHNNDFYLMVLEDDATAISYATYYGGANSPEHVDGGTSRFNRRGEIYQSVCAGCGGFSDFPTTPDAWSATNHGVTNDGAPGCNNGVFKFLLDFPSMIADFEVPPICLSVPVDFHNLTANATDYYWDFGNGATSTDSVATTTYNLPGTYTVMMVANNTTGSTCNITDTVFKQVTVFEVGKPDLGNVITCKNRPIEIGKPATDATSISYLWMPSTALSDSTASNPVFDGSQGPITYQFIISNGVCSDTLLQHVNLVPIPILPVNDTLVCSDVPFSVGFENPDPSITEFEWSPPQNLSNPFIANPIYTPNNSTVLTTVFVYDTLQCVDSVSKNIQVLQIEFFDLPDTSICSIDNFVIDVELPFFPDVTYQWSPAAFVSNPTVHNPTLSTPFSQLFTVIVSNGFCSDTIHKNVEVLELFAAAGEGDTLCIGQSIVIGPDNPSSFLAYHWTPSTWLSDNDIPNPTATPQSSTTYVLDVHALNNPNSCVSADSVTIVVTDPGAGGFTFGEFASCYGVDLTLTPNGNPGHQYHWYTSDGQTGTGNKPTFTGGFDSTIIVYMIVTGDGCTDTLEVPHTFGSYATYWGEMLVPNAFTPNGDNLNECFAPSGVPEGCYWLYVYNRWGVLMFDSYKLEKSCWNGNYMKTNDRVTDGVYFWVLEVATKEYHGTVTVSGRK